MSFTVFMAVLGAALLHAGWNAIIKTGLSKQTSMFLLSVGHALIGFAFALTKPFPAAEVWPWLLASGLIHMAYQLFLAYAYEQGDLSRVYPIARGAAPMMVLLVSVLFLSDEMGVMDYVGVFVLGMGIAFMARGVFTNGESRRLLPFAFGSAMATALPLLVSALANNAAEPKGAEALHQALAKDHDGSILNDVAAFLGDPQAANGAGILGHVLGGKQPAVAEGLAQASGLESDQVGQLLQIAAPLLMGALGQQQKKEGLGINDLTSLLGGQKQLVQETEPGMMGMLNRVLDMDQDGSAVDDVLGMVGKLFGKR